MERIFEEFGKAYSAGNGYDLSMTLSPVAPAYDPDRLNKFFRSTNQAQAQRDFRNKILNDSTTPFTLPSEEGNGWVEVYVAYWKAVGEILKTSGTAETNAKVRIIPNVFFNPASVHQSILPGCQSSSPQNPRDIGFH